MSHIKSVESIIVEGKVGWSFSEGYFLQGRENKNGFIMLYQLPITDYQLPGRSAT